MIYIYILDVGVSYETIERHPSGLHLDLELNIQRDVENLWGNPRTRLFHIYVSLQEVDLWLMIISICGDGLWR